MRRGDATGEQTRKARGLAAQALKQAEGAPKPRYKNLGDGLYRGENGLLVVKF